MFTIPVNRFLESPTVGLKKKNFYLLEKQNWYEKEHLEKITICWQAWWIR